MKRVPIGLTATVLVWALLIPTAVGTPPAAPASAPPSALVATQVPPPSQLPLAAYDLGTLANPSNVRGRDEAVSALIGGKSVWGFGDTLSLAPHQNPPVLKLRTSTGALNVQGFLPTVEPLDGTGFPSAPLVQLTSAEQSYELANPTHRVYVWPNGIIPKTSTSGLVWWHSGTHNASGNDVAGSTRAGIADITAGATTVTNRTTVFTGQDCKWGSPVLDTAGEYVYVYATPDEVGGSNPRSSCPDRVWSALNSMVGRVKLSEAGIRSKYRFWNGSTWVENPLSAVTVHNLINANVVWDEANSAYVAIGGMGNDSNYSTAPSPEGPWSTKPVSQGGGYYPYVAPIPRETPSDGGGFGNYSWRFHREHAGAGGAVQLVSYFHELVNPQFGGRVHLLAVDTRADAATKRRQYVTRMYQVFMGYTPSSANVTYWADRLANRSLTVPEFIRQLTTSLDGRYTTVRRAFKEVFEDVVGVTRVPSQADLAFWADQLTQSGWGHDILTAKLASSAEVRNRYPTNAAYIDAMYRLAFGRPVDSGGLTYWLGQLQPAGPYSTYSFVRYLMRSHEGGQRQAALAYSTILDRSSTANQRDGVADVMTEATQIRIAVASTPEAIGVTN